MRLSRRKLGEGSWGLKANKTNEADRAKTDGADKADKKKEQERKKIMIERGHKKGNKADRANRPVARMRPMGLIGTMGLIGLMGLMGCSSETSEETAKQEMGRTIALYARQGDERPVTRAEQGLEEVLPDEKKLFKVWAFKNSGNNYATAQTVMNNYTVKWSDNSAGTTTTNSDGWEYVNQQNDNQEEQTIKYWDWSATAYRFFGVTECNDAYETNETNRAYVFKLLVDADYPDTCPYYSRLWFSTGDPSAYSTRQFGQPVQLEFVRPIARVRFMFIYENPDDQAITTLSYKRFGPTSGSIHMSGTVTISYPLTGTATTESWSATPDDVGIQALDKDYYEIPETPNDGNVRKWYYVLPVASQGSYKLTVTVNGVEKTAAVPAEFMSWKPGYQYTYIFKVHPDGGVTIDSVQSAFTSWTFKDAGTHTVHNW